MGYIYKITNQINGKVYIGQTIKNPQARFTEHKYHARNPQYHGCKYLHSAIAKYGGDKFSIEIVECCPNKSLDEREVYWIKKYDSYNNGYNLTLGGQGASIDNDVDSILECWSEGISISDIANRLGKDRETISNELKGAGITDAEIHKRCYEVTGEKNRNPIFQYDLQGNFLNEFESIYEAERVLGINKSCISGVLYGQHQVAGEYQWRSYKADNIGADTRKCKTTPKKLYCFETDTVYRSLTEAGKALGIDRHIVKRYIDGKRRDDKYHFKLI